MAHLEYDLLGAPQEFHLDEGDTRIGRSETVHVQFPLDAQISRHHCTIRREAAERFVLIDEQSRNGTRLNGVRVSAEAMPLQDGDCIRLGQMELTFRQRAMGPTTVAFNEIAAKMEEGKGFRTIMREIVPPKR